MSDLINRQQAINAIIADKIEGNALNIIIALGDGKQAETLNEACDRHAQLLNDLPSAQPDFDTVTKIDKAHDDGYKQGYLQGKADYEGKIGKWINGHWDGDSNFHIDGRGNCWFVRECSNCHEEIQGKPTNFCPNCGSMMLKEGEEHETD